MAQRIERELFSSIAFATTFNCAVLLLFDRTAFDTGGSLLESAEGLA
jgi:hypothetical protein